jgi:competence protein ComEA
MLISAIVFGGFTLLWRKPTPPPVAIYAPPSPVVPTAIPTATPSPLVVFISGAVQTPGVYQLPAGARVVDVLQQAGGFTAEANVNATNQAAPLHDGDQIYVPTLVESPSPPPTGLLPTPTSAPSKSTTIEVGESPINVNTASLEELERLPGIGATRAQQIIDNRPYATVDDLDRVPGIGPATLEKLRPLVVVN